MTKRFLFIFIAIFLNIGTCFSQEWSTYSFNELYDFDVKTIYDIKQDANGDFWIGTSQGLFVFDGKLFRQYSHPKFDKEYTTIQFDNEQRPYFINFGGQLFRINNDSVEVVLEGTLDGNFISKYVIHDSSIFYSTNSSALYSLNLRSKEEDEVEFISDKKKGKHRILYLRKAENQLMVLTRLHYTELDGKKSYLSAPCEFQVNLSNINDFTLVKMGKPVPMVSCATMINFNKNRYEIFDFYAKQRFYFWDIETNNSEVNELENSELLSISNAHWIDDKVYLFNKKSILKLLDNQSLSMISPKINATAMLKDREGNIWIGTADKGIFICPNRRITKSEFDVNEITTSLCDDVTKKLFYVSSTGELCVLDYPYVGPKNVIGNEAIPRFRMNVNPFTRELNLCKHSYKYNIDSYAKTPVVSTFFKDRWYVGQDDYFIAGPHDLSFYGEQNSYRTDSKEPIRSSLQLLRKNRVSSISEEKDKTHLYVNFIDGLFVYSKNESPFALYNNGAPILVASMSPNVDGDGVWVGSKQNELFLVVDGEVVQRIELSNQPLRITNDKNFVFILLDSKLIKLDKKSKKQTQIDETNGLKVSDLVDIYALNDTVYCIGGNGCQKVPADFEFKNEVPPVIALSKILLLDREIEYGENDFNSEENQLTFYFKVSNIRSKKQYVIHHRLNDDEWRSTNWQSPFVRYDRLAPGEYFFQAYAINEDGVRSETLTYSFTIQTPLHQTWWFITLVILGSLCVLFLIFYVYIRNIRRQKNLEKEQEFYKKELYKSRISTIRAQMNPHFMFNALNTIQDFILRNESVVASEYLADFADLMRMYLDQSRLDFISLNEEIETTKLYLKLEKLRFGDSFQFEIDVDDNLEVNALEIPVMILQPIIENAIKHGLLHKSGVKTLKISFTQCGENYKVSIEDNGIGFEASLKKKNTSLGHKSFASTAINDRLQLIKLNYDKLILLNIIHKSTSEEYSDQGTIVQLTIPKNFQ